MLFTTAHADRSRLVDALAPGRLAVLFLCAAWCDTCREFHATTQRLAATHPDVAFVWLDIEDDEAIVGDVDVENFPTLAIVRGDTVLHFGVSLPHEAGVARLIEEMTAREQAAGGISDAVRAMVRTLRDGREST
jgi:thioredoxin 1